MSEEIKKKMWEEIQVEELIQHCQFSFKIKRPKKTSIVKRETLQKKIDSEKE